MFNAYDVEANINEEKDIQVTCTIYNHIMTQSIWLRVTFIIAWAVLKGTNFVI
jgi:hypothetical protein